jgi:3-methyladenine DNA glycosylase/8-oxoguanine DNA glycosylase
MNSYTLQYKCPEFYNLEVTCHIHGWKNLTPFLWDSKQKTLNFVVGINGNSIDVLVKQNLDLLKIELQSVDSIESHSMELVDAMLHRSLGLDVCVTELIEVASQVGQDYVNLIKSGAGRMLRSPTLWEDAAKTLFTTNCSWGLTKKICASVCSSQFSAISPSGKFPFPEPITFVDYEADALKKKIPIGYRSTYFISLARNFSTINFLKSLDKPFDQTQNNIESLKGFGAYASNHLLLLMGKFDSIPIDTVVTSYLKKNHRVRKPESFINRHYKKWGQYKWWGFKLETILNKENWLGD